MKKILILLLTLVFLASCMDQDDRLTERVIEETKERTYQENINEVFQLAVELENAVDELDYETGKDVAMEIEAILTTVLGNVYLNVDRQEIYWDFEDLYKTMTFTEGVSHTSSLMAEFNDLMNQNDFNSATFKALEILVFCDRLKDDVEDRKDS